MILQVWSLLNIWTMKEKSEICCIICGKKFNKNEKIFFIDYDFYCNKCKNTHFGDNKK